MKNAFVLCSLIFCSLSKPIYIVFWHGSSAYHLKITHIWFSIQQHIWRTLKPLFIRWFCLQQLNFHPFHIFNLSKSLTRTLEMGCRTAKKRGHSPWEHKCLNGDMLHTSAKLSSAVIEFDVKFWFSSLCCDSSRS